MKVTSKINNAGLKNLNSLMTYSLCSAADAVKSDVLKSQIMPFDTGYMQNDSMYVEDKSKNKGFVLIKVDTPYARKLYYHPEYNFKKDENPFAGGMWFEPWVTGISKMYFPISFAKFMKKGLKKYDTKGN